MQLTEKQVLAIKRKRGELNLSMVALAKLTGVNQWTLRDILKHHHRSVNSITFKKLNDWLIDEYTTVQINPAEFTRKE
ncbi:helix-turn-helix domain-containing protein [Lactobacillus gasseri]|jgi:hypothetical protein|uniref:HTH cro/C1-type domain-containing protein n=1 Tax=Lactobacillus gasseri SV-16A-US TaxID=575604 RepID=A0AB34P024_LACGS|nr:helix-turn-helix transcriptional regulator [Lactobacillus gasseri]KFL96775.1 hypothetical protein HMPREF5175_01252 [Lactobacillus gasseri SV-16A-US]QTH65705.1 helix-turn-helix transcriptional regulator [Lactobacillus gasseri]